MTRRLRIVVTVIVLIGLAAPPSRATAGTDPWVSPLDGLTLDRRFDPPADPYGPGHRGVDLVGRVGDVVRAVAPGRVTFAGQVGSVPVVTVDHGGERSTYQPVVASVRVGDAVTAGQLIGTLIGTHSHCPGACLHLGRLAGEQYLDPLDLLGGGRFRLISPDGEPPPPPAGAGGLLVRPVGGPLTSPFGIRVHPVTGVRKLHDGTDFAAACGTPVHASAAGVVIASGQDGAYGGRITIRHERGLETSYAHLSARTAPVGATVDAGDTIGRVGSTGLSTGCHLHFMVLQDGRPVDPHGAGQG